MVSLSDCGSLFPTFEGYTWLFNHSFQEQTRRASRYGYHVLLLQRLLPRRLGGPVCCSTSAFRLHRASFSSCLHPLSLVRSHSGMPVAPLVFSTRNSVVCEFCCVWECMWYVCVSADKPGLACSVPHVDGIWGRWGDRNKVSSLSGRENPQVFLVTLFFLNYNKCTCF